MKSNTKKSTANKAIEKVERPARLSLAESRDMMYEMFRTNLRVLRAKTKISAVELSKDIGIESGARISLLEYGRGTPTMEEVICISKYFKVSIDDLLYKEAVITFI